MMTVNTTARTVQQAARHARCYDKAQGMEQEGYRVVKVCLDRYDIYTPGDFSWPYTVYLPESTCDCPDWQKHQDGVCKHTLFAQIIKAEEENELAGLEWQCARYDDGEGFLDMVKTPMLVRELVDSMEGELQRTQAAIANHGPRRSNFIQCQSEYDKVGRLESALVLISQHQPLPESEPYDSGWECGKDLADDRY